MAISFFLLIVVRTPHAEYSFKYPTLPVSFERDINPGVYAMGSKRSHTGGKCVTCRGLHNSTWSIMSTRR